MLSAPTTAELATFTGRAESSFGPYASTALAQATLLFALVTKLDTYPDDPNLALLAKYAIMQMADQLVLEQPYQAVKASPMASETIGSYSYTKSQTWQKVTAGASSGLTWWELAIDQLAQGDTSMVASGSYSAFERDDHVVQDPAGDGGYILGPADLITHEGTWVSAENPKG